MTEFKAGDKVRFNDQTNTAWYGVEAEVQSVKPYGNLVVKLTTAATGWASSFVVGSGATLSPFTVELVEPSFTFKDIQKGDTIRRTTKHVGGATEVREGVVTKKGGYFWANDNFILTYDTDDAPEDITLELLNRPEPEPVKEAWETAEAGDQLIVTNAEGTKRVLTKNDDGDWDALLIGTHGVTRGITRSTTSVKSQLGYKNFSDSKPEFVKA